MDTKVLEETYEIAKKRLDWVVKEKAAFECFSYTVREDVERMSALRRAFNERQAALWREYADALEDLLKAG